MDKLNVCLFNDSFPPVVDGVANAVLNYASIIQNQFGQATVVTPSYPNQDDSEFPFEVIRYSSLNTMKLAGYRAGYPFTSKVLREIGDNTFDILHTHCPVASGTIARIVRDKLQKPLILTYHTKFDIDIAKIFSSEVLQSTAIKFLVDNITACDEVWVVSDGAGKNLQSLGYQGDYIVMPNGVDIERRKAPDEKIAQATGGYDLPEDVPTFLYVGRLMWYKGIKITIDALAELAEKGYDFRMVFVGGGKDGDDIEEYVSECNLENKIFFTGVLKDRETLRAWYTRADIFLFPSTFDTNGLVVREAAACSLPSMLIKGSCAAEDVTDGQNGFLIEENSSSMAARLEELYKDFCSVRYVGERAANELYLSWSDVVSVAYERYGVVIDNYNAGLYPTHEQSSDRQIHAMSKFINFHNSLRDIMDHLHS